MGRFYCIVIFINCKIGILLSIDCTLLVKKQKTEKAKKRLYNI
jgi:hypothetical protein